MNFNPNSNNKPIWYSEYFEKKVGLSAEDQKWIWDNVPHPKKNKIVSVKWNVDGTYKNGVNTELIFSKNRGKPEINWPKPLLIEQLAKCTTKTPESVVESLLREIFDPWPSYDDNHWHYIACTYTSRVINWVMSSTLKQYARGGIKKTPAAYFIYRIRHRTKRKKLIGTNDTCKNNES